MKNKLHYLDGCRAIFCMVVFISHFMMAFFPSVKPMFFNDGNLAVMYFLVLSGFVIPLKYVNDKPKKDKCKNSIKDIIRYAILRYFRLLPVIFLSILVSWIILRTGGYYTEEVSAKFNLEPIGNYFNQNVDFGNALFDATFGAFVRRPILNTPLWTIKYEFIGVIVTYIFFKSVATCKFREYLYIVLIIVSYLISKDIYFVCIVSGTFLADLMYNRHGDGSKLKKLYIRLEKKSLKWLALFVICIASGMILINFHKEHFRFLWAFALIILMTYIPKLQKIMETNFLVKLSKYTYMAYAIHWPIICSIACLFMLKFGEKCYNGMAIITFCVSIVILCLCTFLFRKYYEEPIQEMIGGIIKK